MRKSLAVLVTIIAVISLGCSKNQAPSPLAPTTLPGSQQLTGQHDTSLINVLKKVTGVTFRSVYEKDSFYIAEGDILIRKRFIQQHSLSKMQYTDQYNGIVDNSIAPAIRVKIDPSMSPYTSVILSAMSSWNACNSNLKFLQNQTSPQITIYSDPTLQEIGVGELPNGGQPGSRVSINLNYGQVLGATLMHELGHTIGFLHTDFPGDGYGTTPKWIPNTPTKQNGIIMLNPPPNPSDWSKGMDPYSIMLSIQLRYNLAIDAWDMFALHTLYPIPRYPYQGTTISNNQTLFSNEYLKSKNQNYKLILQADGNLVLYNSANRPIWWTGTNGKPVTTAIMQSDGNFVLYRGDLKQYFWCSSTQNHPGAYLSCQNDGNLVIYDVSGKAIWATNTVGR